LTLFFDFDQVPEADRTYYFDDVVVQAGGTAPVDVTFSVDMNDYEGTFTNVYVSGTFNGWSGDAHPLTDDDSDNVWTATVTGVPVGPQEYKFQVDNWAAQESFNGFETCTISDEAGQNSNRFLSVAEEVTVPTVCWNSCYTCGDAIQITINLGEGDITVSEDGLYIAGGNNFGSPGDYPLSDDDGDGVHSITVERQVGFSSFYTFANGACPDFSCKENIGGQDCADPDNFNDRFMGPITQDTVINTCFGICTTTTVCGGLPTVIFEVDMNEYTEAFTTVYVAGNFNGWSGDGNPMTDDDGDGIWTTEISILEGSYEYKFQLDSWAAQEFFDDGDPCTITAGGFTNRLLEVTGVDDYVCYKFNSCDQCLISGINSLDYDQHIFSVYPTISSDFVNLVFGDQFQESKEILLLNGLGQIQKIIQLETGVQQFTLDVTDQSNGIYIINAQTEKKQQSNRIVIQH
jgi:hypothetical protein